MLEDIAHRAYQQFKEAGGITVDLQGHEPTTGYAYGGYVELEKVLPEQAVTPDSILQYMQDNERALAMPGHYLGIWHDAQTGNVFIDVSIVAPPGDDALKDAKDRGQIAVWNIDAGVEIPTGASLDRNITSAVDHQAVLDSNRGQDLAGLPGTVNVPNHGPLTFGSHADIQRVAHEYNQQAGLGAHPQDYVKVNPQHAASVAQEYEAMQHNPHDPQVRQAYDALARETRAQYDHAVRNGYQFEFYPDHDPYPNSPREAVLDLHHNKHMYVYPTEAGYGQEGEDPQDHPLLGDSGVQWNGKPVTHNDLFRAVHDFYGHAKEGLGFRADGEDNAYRQHSAMFSPQARAALASETRGQNSWVNYGPHGEHNQTATSDTVYAPQKAGLMPDWTHEPDLHRGVTSANQWQIIEGKRPMEESAFPDITRDMGWEDRRPFVALHDGRILLGQPGTHHRDLGEEFGVSHYVGDALAQGHVYPGQGASISGFDWQSDMMGPEKDAMAQAVEHHTGWHPTEDEPDSWGKSFARVSNYQWEPGQFAKGALMPSGEVKLWPGKMGTHSEMAPGHLTWLEIYPHGRLDVGGHEEEIRSKLQHLPIEPPKAQGWGNAFASFKQSSLQIMHGTTTKENSLYADEADALFKNWDKSTPVIRKDDTIYVGHPHTHHQDLRVEFDLPFDNRGVSTGHIGPDGYYEAVNLANHNSLETAQALGLEFKGGNWFETFAKVASDMNGPGHTWTKGEYGKGYIDSDGDVHTWNTRMDQYDRNKGPQFGGPHHAEVSAEYGLEDEPEYDTGAGAHWHTPFYIDPEGNATLMDYWAQESGTEENLQRVKDVGLNPVGQQYGGWNDAFGTLQAATQNGTHSYTREGSTRHNSTISSAGMWRVAGELRQPSKPLARCHFHPERYAIANGGFADMCEDCTHSYINAGARVQAPRIPTEDMRQVDPKRLAWSLPEGYGITGPQSLEEHAMQNIDRQLPADTCPNCGIVTRFPLGLCPHCGFHRQAAFTDVDEDDLMGDPYRLQRMIEQRQTATPIIEHEGQVYEGRPGMPHWTVLQDHGLHPSVLNTARKGLRTDAGDNWGDGNWTQMFASTGWGEHFGNEDRQDRKDQVTIREWLEEQWENEGGAQEREVLRPTILEDDTEDGEQKIAHTEGSRAILLHDGTVVSDPDDWSHWELQERHGIHNDQVREYGWISGGQFMEDDDYLDHFGKTERFYSNVCLACVSNPSHISAHDNRPWIPDSDELAKHTHVERVSSTGQVTCMQCGENMGKVGQDPRSTLPNAPGRPYTQARVHEGVTVTQGLEPIEELRQALGLRDWDVVTDTYTPAPTTRQGADTRAMPLTDNRPSCKEFLAHSGIRESSDRAADSWKTFSTIDEWDLDPEPPSKLYHFAPPGMSERILREGIRPTELGTHINQLGNGVYMYGYDPSYMHIPEAGDLYEINGEGLNDLQPDYDIDRAWHHPGPIEPHRIRLLKGSARSASAATQAQTPPGKFGSHKDASHLSQCPRLLKIAAPLMWQWGQDPTGLPRPLAPLTQRDPNAKLAPTPWSQDGDESGTSWGVLDEVKQQAAQKGSLCLLCGEPVQQGFVFIDTAQSVATPLPFYTQPKLKEQGVIDHAPVHDRCAKLTAAHCPHIRDRMGKPEGVVMVPYSITQRIGNAIQPQTPPGLRPWNPGTPGKGILTHSELYTWATNTEGAGGDPHHGDAELALGHRAAMPGAVYLDIYKDGGVSAAYGPKGLLETVSQIDPRLKPAPLDLWANKFGSTGPITPEGADAWEPGEHGKGLWHPDKGLALWKGYSPHHFKEIARGDWPEGTVPLRILRDGGVADWTRGGKAKFDISPIVQLDPRLKEYTDPREGWGQAFGSPNGTGRRDSELSARIAGEIPRLVEHEIRSRAGESDFGGKYQGRRPLVYDPDSNAVHIGSPGSIHADLVGHADLRYAPRLSYGWLGHNPEASRVDVIEGKGKSEYGWMHKHPGPHVDEAIKHLRPQEAPSKDDWGTLFSKTAADEIPVPPGKPSHGDSYVPWKPGDPGKGWYDPETTELEMWKVFAPSHAPGDNYYHPFHGETSFNRGRATPFWVDPNGTVSSYGQSVNDVTEGLVEAHPHFKDEKWDWSDHFGKIGSLPGLRTPPVPQVQGIDETEMMNVRPWEPGVWGKGVVVDGQPFGWRSDHPMDAHHDGVLDHFDQHPPEGVNPKWRLNSMFFLDPKGLVVGGQYGGVEDGWNDDQVAKGLGTRVKQDEDWADKFGAALPMKVVDVPGHDTQGDAHPIAYVPSMQTVFKGERGMDHWGLVENSPELGQLHYPDEGMVSAHPLERTMIPVHHGRMADNGEVHFFNESAIDVGEHAQVAKALGGKPKFFNSWDQAFSKVAAGRDPWQEGDPIEPWEPGHPGKGMMLAGKPLAWKITDQYGGPHHNDVAYAHDSSEEHSPQGYFHIDPDGTTQAEGYADVESFVQHDPRLKLPRELTKWDDVFQADNDPEQLLAKTADWNGSKLGLPDIIEGTTPGEKSLFRGQIAPDREGTRPVVYHKPSQTVYLGQPGTHHADVVNEHSLHEDAFLRGDTPGWVEEPETEPYDWTSDMVGDPHMKDLYYGRIEPMHHGGFGLTTWGGWPHPASQALHAAGHINEVHRDAWDESTFAKVASLDHLDLKPWTPGKSGKFVAWPSKVVVWGPDSRYKGSNTRTVHHIDVSHHDPETNEIPYAMGWVRPDGSAQNLDKKAQEQVHAITGYKGESDNEPWGQSFAAVWNPRTQEWDLTPEEKAQIKINLVRRQGAPTDGAFNETNDAQFRQRTPILYKHDTVWAGHPGDTHQDIADEFGLGDVDDLDTYHHGSWLPQGGFNKEPGTLNWLYNSGSLKKEWNEAIMNALNAKEEPQDWGQAFASLNKEAQVKEIPQHETMDYEDPEERPFIYDRQTGIIHLGHPGDSHSRVYNGIGMGDVGENIRPWKERMVSGAINHTTGQINEHTDEMTDEERAHVWGHLGQHLGVMPREPEGWADKFAKVAGHNLVWEPGWPGKGFYHNGELTTWGVSSNNPLTAWPHHAHMWGQKYPGTKMDEAEPFVFAISPEGGVKRAAPYGQEAPEIYQIEPRLKQAQEEEWHSQF
jgi:hypothetical protein